MQDNLSSPWALYGSIPMIEFAFEGVGLGFRMEARAQWRWRLDIHLSRLAPLIIIQGGNTFNFIITYRYFREQLTSKLALNFQIVSERLTRVEFTTNLWGSWIFFVISLYLGNNGRAQFKGHGPKLSGRKLESIQQPV